MKMNTLKLYENALRLYEIAKEYKNHLVMAATEDEDMSLADEIDKIVEEVEE